MIDDYYLVGPILVELHRLFRALRRRHAPPQSPRRGRENVHLLIIFGEDQQYLTYERNSIRKRSNRVDTVHVRCLIVPDGTGVNAYGEG